MNEYFESAVAQATGATDIVRGEAIQSLWSGYGEIVRYALGGSEYESVVVKHVRLPVGARHPRGWNTDRSHQRKVRSYQVEIAWYEHWSNRCGEPCRVPRCLAVESKDDEVLMVLEDLDASGFSERRSTVSDADVRACLSWLAHFHATFLNEVPSGLWECGTYWHLDTRPDELQALEDRALKSAAQEIDRRLKACPYQTIVHGDAKLANFCFADNGQTVAAVDFQYVGGGCGMKDVAYFIGSCLDEEQCARQEEALLEFYFKELDGSSGFYV